MTQDRSVTISGIIPRNDRWNSKVGEVNDSLARMCENDNISFIDHSRSIDPRKNLNNSKLHLITKSSNKLRDNFCQIFKRLFQLKATLKSDTIKALLEKYLLLSEMKILDLHVLLIASLLVNV